MSLVRRSVDLLVIDFGEGGPESHLLERWRDCEIYSLKLEDSCFCFRHRDGCIKSLSKREFER